MSLLGHLATAAVCALTGIAWRLGTINWVALSAIGTFVLAGVAVASNRVALSALHAQGHERSIQSAHVLTRLLSNLQQAGARIADALTTPHAAFASVPDASRHLLDQVTNDFMTLGGAITDDSAYEAVGDVVRLARIVGASEMPRAFLETLLNATQHAVRLLIVGGRHRGKAAERAIHDAMQFSLAGLVNLDDEIQEWRDQLVQVHQAAMTSRSTEEALRLESMIESIDQKLSGPAHELAKLARQSRDSTQRRSP